MKYVYTYTFKNREICSIMIIINKKCIINVKYKIQKCAMKKKKDDDFKMYLLLKNLLNFGQGKNA